MVVRCFFKNIIRTKSHCFHPKLLIPINFVEKNFFRHSPDGSRFPRNFLLPSAIVVVQLKITSEMFVTKKAWKWRGLWLNRGGKERDLRWQQEKKKTERVIRGNCCLFSSAIYGRHYDYPRKCFDKCRRNCTATQNINIPGRWWFCPTVFDVLQWHSLPEEPKQISRLESI